MSNSRTDVDDDPETDDEEAVRMHLEDIETGAGCAEIWERLTEHRTED
jgi:hypothetical protein